MQGAREAIDHRLFAWVCGQHEGASLAVLGGEM